MDDKQAPAAKKPKLEGKSDVSISGVRVLASRGSAVTVLATEGSVLFSGHRNGVIQRWELDAIGTEKVNPRLRIQSCADLTNDPTYSSLDALGVAGIVVRKPQMETHEHTLLYTWNHQREDMRATNGIPNKVMIWKCSTGERVAALMLDVGRCDTGMFANPLCSCLIFCPLLIETVEPSSAKKQYVWSDSVLVGLQATCDEARSSSTSINVTSEQNCIIGGEKRATPLEVKLPRPPSASLCGEEDSKTKPTSVAAKLGAIGTQQLPPAVVDKLAGRPLQQNKTSTRTLPPSGNMLPFAEQSRKRMPPWAATGGFVRALACIPQKYVISVTEIVRTVATANPGHEERTGDPQCRNDVAEDGEANEVILWDAAKPGTILHRIKLFDKATFDGNSHCGNVFGFWLTSTDTLVLACRFGNWINLKQIHIEEQGDSTLSDSKYGAMLKHGQNTKRENVVSASAGIGDLIALAGADSVDVVFYRNLSECGRESLNLPGPNTLAFAASKLIAAYSDGMILEQTTRLDIPTDPSDWPQRAHCSTVSQGLRGMLCPNLTSSSNSVQLQNQCSVQ